MILTFNVSDIGNRLIRILDITQEGDEYIPEDLLENEYSLLRYFNYKYTETCTINVLLYNSTSGTGVSNVSYTAHDSHLDEAIMKIDKDGYYTLSHMVIPTVQWLKRILSEEKLDISTYSSIYVTDGYKIYKYVDGDLVLTNEYEITQVNTVDTTISRCEKNFFHLYDLYTCFIGFSNSVFNNSMVKCPEKSSSNLNDLRYYRDFIWSAISVIKIYTEMELYESALLLLEKLDSCNGICKKNKYLNDDTVSSCGCS